MGVKKLYETFGIKNFKSFGTFFRLCKMLFLSKKEPKILNLALVLGEIKIFGGKVEKFALYRKKYANFAGFSMFSFPSLTNQWCTNICSNLLQNLRRLMYHSPLNSPSFKSLRLYKTQYYIYRHI